MFKRLVSGWVVALGMCSLALGMGSTGAEKPVYRRLDLAAITRAEAAPLTQKELAATYAPGSDATTLQQESRLRELLGKRVQWEILIADIAPEGTDVFRVQGRSDREHMGTFVYLTARNAEEAASIRGLQKGQTVRVVGLVQDMALRHMVINPAELER